MKYGKVYFLGIGGIGMSAEARYFLHEGRRVAGYDRTPSELTAELRREGAEVTYDESTDAIPAGFRSSDDTLVVYTPAIPEDHPQLRFFRDGGFEVVKRSRLLGAISEGKYVMAVAGTHGKTTTTKMAAWFNRVAGGGGSAFLGGVVFNAANILLAAAIAISGLSVAFPVGIGLALVLGVLVNYFGEAKGQPLFILLGVVLIVVAIVLNGMAYRKMLKGTQKVPAKGIGISIAAGIIMAFFYRFVAASMDLTDFAHPAAGKLTPYTAVFVFAVGVFASNFIFNTIAMKRPVEGPPIRIGGYFRGSAGTHMVGMVGGMIWCLGQSFSMIASGQAGAAISYGLGQGATLVSALWGILVWKEFRSAPAVSKRLNLTMFILFVIGLGFLVYAGA